jgi:hypothetical protein
MSTFNHVIPPAILVQIGDMTVSFGLLEFHMRWIFVYLVNQSAIIGEVLASYLSFRNLRAALSSLYKERFGENVLYSELKDLLAEAATIEQERNTITHSSWLAGQTAMTVTRHKVIAHQKAGFKAEFQQYSERDLLAFNQRIQNLAGKFVDFYHKLPDEIPSP